MPVSRPARGPIVGPACRPQKSAPANVDPYFDEIHVASDHNFHFAKSLKAGRAAIMLVTFKTINIGMGWAQLKAALPAVEPLIP